MSGPGSNSHLLASSVALFHQKCFFLGKKFPRNLPALQTVGYKEIFDYLDGKVSLDEAARLIRRNTRHYAKKQLTWLARYPEIEWRETVRKVGKISKGAVPTAS